MSQLESARAEPLVVDRYAVYESFASGGMAAVHYGLWLRDAQFTRPVAVKRLHPDFAKDATFVAAFVQEARLASRVRHPNVIATLDVVVHAGEVLLVSELVEGESLMKLIAAASDKGARVPFEVTAAVLSSMLHGLHAAHTATDESGQPMRLVHRDVSPQNVVVGLDGTVRLIDFGIAKAIGGGAGTRQGQIKGKLGYMAPERLKGDTTVASDLYAVGVCAWEMLTLQRMFRGDNPSVVLAKISSGLYDPPSKLVPDVPAPLEAVVLKALDRDPQNRFKSAEEMAAAIEATVTPAPASAVARWVDGLKGEAIRERAKRVADIEREAHSRSPLLSVTAPQKKLPLPWIVAGALCLIAGALVVASLVRPAATQPAVDASAPIGSDASSAAVAPTSVAAASSSVAPSPSAARSSAPTNRVPTPTTNKPNCDPPYVVDPTGVRRYKKECFKH